MRGSEPRRWRAPALLGVAMVLALATPAAADYAYFTGSWYQNNYVSGGKVGCLNNGGCTNHSYTFISGEDIGGANSICPRIWLAGAYETNWSMSCGTDFVRHCSPHRQHDNNPINCHDQDDVTNLHAGVINNGAGTTIRMHGGY